MPLNKSALIRYKTIDQCLQNRFRKWTLEDLMEAVGDALYELEGITTGVSKRTIQLDIQNMRSDKLGYEAPIVVTDRKFYTYSDPTYSITRSPISSQDTQNLQAIIQDLKQFQGFGFYDDLIEMVTKLEDAVLTRKDTSKAVIAFDRNEQLKGLSFLNPIHQAIRKERVLALRYQSFKSTKKHEWLIHPFLLKEYNNRWFLLCYKDKEKDLSIIALDRILDIRESLFENRRPVPENLSTYFDNIVGVTKNERQKAEKVLLKISKEEYPYHATKPLHPSQQMIREEEDGVLVLLKVIPNFELERVILGMGEKVEIIAPRKLRNRIKRRLLQTTEKYIKK